MDTYQKLNNEQLKCVKHNKGPLMVVAGAGTGKTTVIVERIKYLIMNRGINPSDILALTFTEKAASEMEERIDVALSLGYSQMWISTFHSFCDRILRQEALAIGLTTSYDLMTTSETMRFITKHLYDFDFKYYRPLGNPNKFIKGLCQHFSRLQDEDVTADQYCDWVKSNDNKKHTEDEQIEVKKWNELSNAYKKYCDLKIHEGKMDFGDLITNTLKLFRVRPNILMNYQKKFSYILVDEYQDTNIAQNELVKMLANDDENITVVLDDDQSIYRFRGAAVSNAIQFRNSFPKVKTITLINNYRSRQEILDNAYNLIQFNNPDRLEVVEKINKKLISKIAGKGEVKFIHEANAENEARVVADEIFRMTRDDYQYNDVAILVRANDHASSFINALARKNIPYQFLGPGKLFLQKEIQEIIAYLKVVNDPDDSLSLFRLIASDYFAINVRDLKKITSYARKKNKSLFEVLEDDLRDISITKGKSGITKIYKLLQRHIELSEKSTAGSLVYTLLDETGMLKRLLDPDTPDVEKITKNISKFFDKLKNFETKTENANVQSVVEWIDLMIEEGESPAAAEIDWINNNAVNILTIHSSKGLEFPCVFLVNLVSQRFPTSDRKDQIPIPDGLIKEVVSSGDHHLQEERRLCYVGVTRAQEKLYLTAADYYGEGKRTKRLSPFIFETLGDEAIRSEVENSVQLSFADYKKTDDRKVEQVNEKLHIDYLSYSQIQTFEICPLHYKLKYLLNVPTPKTAPISFGVAIHQTLNDIYKHAVNGVNVTDKLAQEFLEKNWVSEGFTHKIHEDLYRKKGRAYIQDYVLKSFRKQSLPIAVEHSFLVNLTDPKHKGRSLKIGGKIDRIDRLPQGVLRIVDYKTSEDVPSQREVDKNDQLTFYALAASKIKEPPFNVTAEKIILCLYYFENQSMITSVRGADQLSDFENKIFRIREDIENSDFSCSHSYICQKDCEFSNFCLSDK
ncbi:UvrD-helicase domain-containing protein [Candidatus Woesebacteria bacterium]|nr:MAG: UvrD-helicase domain-containing protein [Candidatus Woesebacteria bacterium]